MTVTIPTQTDEYIKRYLNSLTNQSQNTIDMYTKDLEIFNDYMNREGISVITATLDNLQSYAKYLKNDLEYADSTSNRKLQLVKYLYKYLYRNMKVIKENPAEFLDLPKIPQRLPKFLNLNEAKKLIKVVDKEKNDFLRIRDKAILLIFINNGLRVEEVSNLKLSNIKGDRLTFIGKGNKERFVILNDDTLNAINEYLTVRFEVDTRYLFLSTRRKKISVRSVQSMVDKYLKLAKLEGYSVHKLRHTSAVMMIEQGVGIRTIQDLYGHSDVKTTEIYASVTEGSKRDAANKMNGLFTD